MVAVRQDPPQDGKRVPAAHGGPARGLHLPSLTPAARGPWPSTPHPHPESLRATVPRTRPGLPALVRHRHWPPAQRRSSHTLPRSSYLRNEPTEGGAPGDSDRCPGDEAAPELGASGPAGSRAQSPPPRRTSGGSRPARPHSHGGHCGPQMLRPRFPAHLGPLRALPCLGDGGRHRPGADSQARTCARPRKAPRSSPDLPAAKLTRLRPGLPGRPRRCLWGWRPETPWALRGFSNPAGGRRKAARGTKAGPPAAALTCRLGLGPRLHGAVLVVDGLAGQREDPDLGHLDGGLLEAAAEAEHLAALGGVLHHLRRGSVLERAVGQGQRRGGRAAGDAPVGQDTGRDSGGQCQAQPPGADGCRGGGSVQRLRQEQTVREAVTLGHRAPGSVSRDPCPWDTRRTGHQHRLGVLCGKANTSPGWRVLAAVPVVRDFQPTRDRPTRPCAGLPAPCPVTSSRTPLPVGPSALGLIGPNPGVGISGPDYV